MNIKATGGKTATLSRCQAQVLELLAAHGLTQKEAADTIGLSVKMVNAHALVIKKKKRARTLAHAAYMAGLEGGAK